MHKDSDDMKSFPSSKPGDQDVLSGRITVPIYYEDTDFSGYVYHANYLKFFERAREELIGRRYLRDLFNLGLHYVVGRIQISYHLPAKHGDVLEIQTSMKLTDSPVTTFEQTAYRLPDDSQENERLRLVTATVKVVAVDSKGQATSMPSEVSSYFKSLASKSD